MNTNFSIYIIFILLTAIWALKKIIFKYKNCKEKSRTDLTEILMNMRQNTDKMIMEHTNAKIFRFKCNFTMQIDPNDAIKMQIVRKKIRIQLNAI